MDVVIVSQEQVAALLSMPECVGAMERVLAELAAGACMLPPRKIMWLPERVGALGMMPSYLRSTGMIGLKAVTFFPGNEGTELDSHQGVVMLFEGARGRLLALIDATSITAIRTAAVSAVATKCLARQDARTLALVGSGVQARMHLQAMLLCRGIERVLVCSKTAARARAFAEAESPRCGVTIEATASVEEAVRGADVVCTCTTSAEPVVRGAWIEEGTHINAVGSSVASAREWDAAAVRRSRLFVDRREAAINEAGDFLLAKQEGAVGNDHIVGEIGQVVAGDMQGRTSDREVTMFKSVGLAVEDLAAAALVYEKARASDAAARVSLGGRRYGTR